MAADDDIAKSLPQPPPPRPARREAAIEAALQRFDGGPTAPARRPEYQAGQWWTRIRRPQAGALVAAGLVAVLALPFAWMSFDPPRAAAPSNLPAAEGAADNYSAADMALDEPGSAVEPPAAAAAPASARPADAGSAPPATATAAAEPSPAKGAERAPAEPAPESPPLLASAGAAEAEPQVIVTGSRIRTPARAAPAAAIAARDGAPRTSARRGDWNACTVDDPERSLAACPGLSEWSSKRGADSPLADGLSRAWSGDLDGAIGLFGQAIARSPRSAAAYLNRGLAHRRRGESDEALADLDRAVRYSPGSARAYYNRSLVLRDRGDFERAQADERRAAALDSRYGAVAPRGE